MSTENIVKTTVSELKKILSPENIVGEKIILEDKVLIPITKIGLGFGSGSAGGKGQGGDKQASGGEGSGSGAGGGAGVAPVALIAVFKGTSGPDGVKVIPLESPSPLSKAISEVLPSITEAIKKRTSKASKDEKTK